MPDTYKDFQREPSKSHQCMHFSEQDGTRCQAMSMHNEYMCYAHRSDEILTVIQNDMFLIDNLDTHAAIQKAFGDVAARLACNHIDLKRAELLITLLRAAARNLRDVAREAAAARREAAAAALEPVSPTGAPHLASEMWVPPAPPEPQQEAAPPLDPVLADAAPTAASTHPEDSSMDQPTQQEAPPAPAPPVDFDTLVSRIPGSLHFGVVRPLAGWDDRPASEASEPPPPNGSGS